MIILNAFIANIPKQECVVDIMTNNITDTYVFIAPEIIE